MIQLFKKTLKKVTTFFTKVELNQLLFKANTLTKIDRFKEALKFYD